MGDVSHEQRVQESPARRRHEEQVAASNLGGAVLRHERFCRRNRVQAKAGSRGVAWRMTAAQQAAAADRASCVGSELKLLRHCMYATPRLRHMKRRGRLSAKGVRPMWTEYGRARFRPPAASTALSRRAYPRRSRTCRRWTERGAIPGSIGSRIVRATRGPESGPVPLLANIAGHCEMRDSRLIGTWKSDRHRTLREIRPCDDLSPRAQSLYDRVFGKLILKYTQTTFTASGIGDAERTKYRVIASDSESVVIQFADALTESSILRQIHFDGPDRYWIALGRFREWFRRLQ